MNTSDLTILNDGSASPIKFPYLRKFNLTMGILHLIQGLTMIILGLAIDTLRDFSLRIYGIFLDYQSVPGGGVVPIAEMQELFIFKAVGPTVASFLLLSSLAHFLIAGPLYNYYVENLKRKMNPIRWFEYALSSSVMVVFISMLFGVREIWVLGLIFAINAMMNLFGHMMELHNQTTEKTNWTAYIYGWIAGMMPWVVITFYFVKIALEANQIPWFVPVIYIVQFLLFMSFAFNMLLQYKRVGPWKDYLYGERAYQILSLVAKTLLAWLVFAGVLQPS